MTYGNWRKFLMMKLFSYVETESVSRSNNRESHASWKVETARCDARAPPPPPNFNVGKSAAQHSTLKMGVEGGGAPCVTANGSHKKETDPGTQIFNRPFHVKLPSLEIYFEVGGWKGGTARCHSPWRRKTGMIPDTQIFNRPFPTSSLLSGKQFWSSWLERGNHQLSQPMEEKK